jgi:hypothetical protein
MEAIFIQGMELCLAGGRFALAWLSAAMLARLMWHCMLRPGEAYRLTVSDLLFSTSPDGVDVLVVAIKDAKNRAQLGAGQFAVCRDQATVAYLQWYIADLPPWSPLWPMHAASFIKFFKSMLSHLKLAHLGFSPAGLRAGAATARHLEGQPVDVLRFAGRWLSDRSLQCYIQEAVSALVWAQIPRELRATLLATVSLYSEILARPPTQPWRLIIGTQLAAARLKVGIARRSLLSTCSPSR